MKIVSIFKNNKEWAKKQIELNPNFFADLSKQQKPNYLWIGCSDSRVPTNQIMEVPPGEVFVHRNIANVVHHTDFNCLSVIEYAVDVLKVENIIVCGHYGCGGVKAAVDNYSEGYVGNWIGNIKNMAKFHEEELNNLNGDAKYDRACELNVIEQVESVSNTTIVQSALKRGAKLKVHGWIYNMKNGILSDLLESN
jgi:carbonic anhydrase